jgi:hypothetical protein
MKYVLYVIFAIVAFLLFFPTTDSDQIRNLPLLIAILVIAAGFVLFALIRRVVLFQKIKKAIKKRGCEIIKSAFNPFAARLHGRYSVTFKRNGKIICARLLIKQIKYQRYHFESAELIEFYRSNRVVFQSTKIRGATVSDLVETKKVGRQPLKWEKADCNIIIFNKIPDHITDSKQKNLLVKGDKVCGTETYIADVESFLNFLDANDN